ncbi:hypothetical protein N9N28_16065 [Rubripirellula amarantea]|nr:hypothetical protein [Rubripirellula amarantea]
MKTNLSLLLAVAVALGCTGTQDDAVVVSAGADFDTAIETLATSSDLADVNASLGILYGGGVPAIEALREHLSDDRVIPAVHTTRLANGTATVGDQAFWTIQEMIEPFLFKSYSGNYSVLTREGAEQWLDSHRGMTIVGLQIEATSTALTHAKRDLEMTGSPEARMAIEICRERLTELRRSR